MAEQAPVLHQEHISLPPPAIHFERGSHASTIEQNTQDFYRFLAGDKTAHGWNKEVTKSMASYQPQYIALDGQTPLLTGELAQFTEQRPLPLTDIQKQLLWFALPGAPSEINTQGVVSMVAGDVRYNDLFPFFRNSNQIVQDGQTMLAIQNAYDTLNTDSSNDLLRNPKVNGRAQLLELSGEDLAVALPIAFGAKAIARRIIDYQPSRYNRREFFKRNIPRAIGVAALLSGFSGLTAERIAMTTGDQIENISDEQTRETIQTIAAIMRPRLARSIYADGRTALLNAKLRSYMDGKQGAGAVIMGAFHDPDVVHSQKDAVELIRAYAQDSIETIHELREALKVKPSPSETKQLDNGIVAYFAKTDVYTVSDPGGPTMNPNLANIVPKHVRYEGTFQCPQVEKAVRGLV